MNKIEEEYEALIEDMEAKGVEDIYDILLHKESIKDITSQYKIRHNLPIPNSVDIKSHGEAYRAAAKSLTLSLDDEVINKQAKMEKELQESLIVRTLGKQALSIKNQKSVGFDTRYPVVLDFLRTEGKYQWCICGSERFDKDWLNTRVNGKLVASMEAVEMGYDINLRGDVSERPDNTRVVSKDELKKSPIE